MQTPPPHDSPFFLRIDLRAAPAATRRLSDRAFALALLLQALLASAIALLSTSQLEHDRLRQLRAARLATQASARLADAPAWFMRQGLDNADIAALDAWLRQADPASDLFDRLRRLTPRGAALISYHQDEQGNRIVGQTGDAQALQQMARNLAPFRVLHKDASAAHGDMPPMTGFRFQLGQPLAVPPPAPAGDAS